MLRSVRNSPWGAALFLCVFIYLWSGYAKALVVSPLTLDLTSAGTNNKATLRVRNDSTAPIPIEIIVARLSITSQGVTQSKSAEGDFLIFPPQATIPAGGSQAFRVQWTGQPDLKASQTYIFSVNQLPVAFEANRSGVQIVLNFAVLVNVSPPNAKPDVSLVTFELGDQQRPTLMVQNKGSKHALLTEGTVTLEGAGWKKIYAGADLLEALGGMGLVQPGQQRQFVFKTPVPSEVTRITGATIELAGSR